MTAFLKRWAQRPQNIESARRVEHACVGYHWPEEPLPVALTAEYSSVCAEVECHGNRTMWMLCTSLKTRNRRAWQERLNKKMPSRNHSGGPFFYVDFTSSVCRTLLQIGPPGWEPNISPWGAAQIQTVADNDLNLKHGTFAVFEKHKRSCYTPLECAKNF